MTNTARFEAWTTTVIHDDECCVLTGHAPANFTTIKQIALSPLDVLARLVTA